MKKPENREGILLAGTNIQAGYPALTEDNIRNSGSIFPIALRADVLGNVKFDGVCSEQFIQTGGIGRFILAVGCIL